VHIILLFALIQGFTEFIPVSSQGHLIVFNSFFNINLIANISVLEANVIAHSGSFVAVCLYYWRQIFLLLISLKHIMRPDIDSNSNLIIHLAVATTPILVCGFFFSKFFDYDNKSLFMIVGITSILFGIILFVFDKFCLTVKGREELNFLTSLIVGIFQCFALIPGVSRSGSIIIILRFFGYNRNFAVFFSNILSIPVILVATVYIIYQNQEIFLLSEYLNLYPIGIFFFSLFFSLVFLKFLISWVKSSSFLIFAIYRVIFGSVLIYFFLTY
jgi:undecaprenyl-diphosphatase